jgi:hypothetical protein
MYNFGAITYLLGHNYRPRISKCESLFSGLTAGRCRLIEEKDSRVRCAENNGLASRAEGYHGRRDG